MSGPSGVLLGSAVPVPAEVGQIQALAGSFSSLGAKLSQAAASGDFGAVLDAVQGAEAALGAGGVAAGSSVGPDPVPTDQLLASGFLGSAGPPSSLLASGLGAGPVSGAAVVAEAERFLGVPYRWGGTSPTTGFDCSGFVQYVYQQLGISLPRTSEEQATVGVPVPSLAEAQPGDLVFFAGSDGTPSSPGHVGIYIGNGQMIDAPETGEDVSVQPVGDPVAIRRVLPTAGLPTAGLPTGGLPTGGLPTGGLPGPALDAVGASGLAALGVPTSLIPLFEQAGAANGISPTVLAAVAAQESGFDPNAVSSAGAEGIMQLMPATAASLGVDPFDPAQAINGAAQLLAGYLQTYGGSLPLALAAYNAGPGAVATYGGVPPFAQTQAYVTDILQRLQEVA